MYFRNSIMDVHDEDFAYLALLECAAALPVESTMFELEKDGLIERFTGGWRLTELGRLKLRNLGSVAAHAKPSER